MVTTKTTEERLEVTLTTTMMEESIVNADVEVRMVKVVTSTGKAKKITTNMGESCTFLTIIAMRAEGVATIKTRCNSVNSMQKMKQTFSTKQKSSTTTTFASLSERGDLQTKEIKVSKSLSCGIDRQ